MVASKFNRYAKRQSKRFGKWTKQRYGTWSKPKINNIVKDVAMLKDMINAEKKRIVVSGYTQLLGQVSGTGSGHYYTDLTPTPTEALTYNGRTGASIKWCSSHLQFQVSQQSADVSPIKFKMYFIETKGTPQSLATASTTFLTPTPFVTGTGNIYDYNSSINPDYFGQFKVLRTQTFTMPVDSITGQTQVKNIKIGMKWNRGQGSHVRFDKDSTTVTDGQIWLLIVADNGNCSTGTPNTASSGVINKAVNTGLSMSLNFTHYYYDN